MLAHDLGGVMDGGAEPAVEIKTVSDFLWLCRTTTARPVSRSPDTCVTRDVKQNFTSPIRRLSGLRRKWVSAVHVVEDPDTTGGLRDGSH